MDRDQAVSHSMLVVTIFCLGVGLAPSAEATVVEVPCGPEQDAEVFFYDPPGIRSEVHAECSTQSTVEVSSDPGVVDVLLREDAPGIRECASMGIRTFVEPGIHTVECKGESYKTEAVVRAFACIDLIAAYEQGESVGVGACQAWMFNPGVAVQTCSLLSCPQLFDIWENCDNDPNRSREECIDVAISAWIEQGEGRTPEECGICPAPDDEKSAHGHGR